MNSSSQTHRKNVYSCVYLWDFRVNSLWYIQLEYGSLWCKYFILMIMMMMFIQTLSTQCQYITEMNRIIHQLFCWRTTLWWQSKLHVSGWRVPQKSCTVHNWLNSVLFLTSIQWDWSQCYWLIYLWDFRVNSLWYIQLEYRSLRCKYFILMMMMSIQTLSTQCLHSTEMNRIAHQLFCWKTTLW
jgi:hypothetical protein